MASSVASANLFDLLSVDDEPEVRQSGSKTAAPAKAAAPKAAAQDKPQRAARPLSPPQQLDTKPEDAMPTRAIRGGKPYGDRRGPREETRNDRHLARNGASRDISKQGGGRANWGGNQDETRTRRGPNSQQPDLVADVEAAAGAEEPAATEETAAPVEEAKPEAPAEPDPADKYISLEEYLAQKEAKRVADDLAIKVRDVVIDDKQFKAGKAAVSQKNVVENDFSDLKKPKKDKKAKAESKRAGLEATDLYPVGVVNAPAPRAFSPRADGESRGPRPDGAFAVTWPAAGAGLISWPCR